MASNALELSVVDNANSRDTISKTLVYIMPQRIQKKMLQDVRNAMKRIKLPVKEQFGDGVTHIVTEYSEHEQVVRQLERDRVVASDINKLEKVKIVRLSWLSGCFKAGTVVDVQEQHLVKKRKNLQTGSSAEEQGRAPIPFVPPWACQRSAPLDHYNHRYTEMLEILEKHAEFRDNPNDYSRALAFRRASCVLKSLPFPVERLSQAQGLKDIGDHALKVIQDVLEVGYSEEVKEISNSEWFKLMKEFIGVFGVGSATAKKWIDKGWKSITDVRQSGKVSNDERVIYGLAFYEDLVTPVTLTEARAFTDIVRQQAEQLLPGVVTTLVGGFRRGKQCGHDVDILLTHPDEGLEVDLLTSLLQCLAPYVLMGRHEASSFRPEAMHSDSKVTTMRGQLDHFEKWLGICRFEDTWGSDRDSSLAVASSVARSSNTGISVAGAAVGGCTDCTGKRTDLNNIVMTDSEQHEEAKSSKGTPSMKVGMGTIYKGLDSDSNVMSYNAKNDCDRKRAERSSNDKLEQKCDGQPTAAANDSSNAKRKSDMDKGDHQQAKRAKQSGGRFGEGLQQHPALLLAAGPRSWKARRVDLIVVPYSQYFYALVGWTGNKHFNRDMRTYAKRQLNMHLTSHGLWDLAKQQSLPAASEEEVFASLQLKLQKPEHRNC